MTRYRVVVADPAWKFSDSLGKRGAASKYRTEKLEQIAKHKLPPLADDCVLFLWRMAVMLEEAHYIARAWGFDPTKGEMIWQKLTTNGLKHFGMGNIVRGSHEGVLLCTRGRPRRLVKNVRSTFEAAVPRYPNGKIIHSAKPDEFFRIVTTLYDGPRVSIFERKQREGFDCFGDEMGSVQ